MLKRVHGRAWLAWYALKVAASIVVATAAAVALQIGVDLPAVIGADRTMVPPDHVMNLLVSLGVVLTAVIAWELGLEAMCTRLERHPLRLAAAVGVLATGVFVTHTFVRHYLEPQHALAAAAMLMAVWVLTLAILARADRVFTRFTGDA